MQCNVKKAMCSTMCSGAMHKLVRRGLLLRDELGRPQWAAISNNLPSLGSAPALHMNFPLPNVPNVPSLGSAPESQLQQCSSTAHEQPNHCCWSTLGIWYIAMYSSSAVVVGLSLECWPFVRRHLESPGWGRGCRHYPQWIGGGAKQKPAPGNQKFIL